MKWMMEAAALAAVVLLKLIPAIGAAPWVCALVDAVFLLLLLRAAAVGKERTVSVAAVFMPLLDWAQGAISGLWVPCIALGFFLAARFWGKMDARILTRVICCLLSAYILRMAGVAMGYVLLKEMPVLPALRSVVRNGWFYFGWYAAAVCAAAFTEMRKKQGKHK